MSESRSDRFERIVEQHPGTHKDHCDLCLLTDLVMFLLASQTGSEGDATTLKEAIGIAREEISHVG